MGDVTYTAFILLRYSDNSYLRNTDVVNVLAGQVNKLDEPSNVHLRTTADIDKRQLLEMSLGLPIVFPNNIVNNLIFMYVFNFNVTP